MKTLKTAIIYLQLLVSALSLAAVIYVLAVEDSGYTVFLLIPLQIILSVIVLRIGVSQSENSVGLKYKNWHMAGAFCTAFLTFIFLASILAGLG